MSKRIPTITIDDDKVVVSVNNLGEQIITPDDKVFVLCNSLREHITKRDDIFREIKQYMRIEREIALTNISKPLIKKLNEFEQEYMYYWKEREQIFIRRRSQLSSNIKADYYRVRAKINKTERIKIKNMRLFANVFRNQLKNMDIENRHALNLIDVYDNFYYSRKFFENMFDNFLVGKYFFKNLLSGLVWCEYFAPVA